MPDLVLTEVGYATAMAARRRGVRVSISEFEVREYGTDYTPYKTDDSLRGDVLYRGPIDRIHTDERGNRVFRLLVPDNSTPGHIYEIGLYLDTGELFAIGICSPRYDKTYPYLLRIYCTMRPPEENQPIEFEGILVPTLPTVQDYCDLPSPNISGNNVWVVKNGHCGGDSNPKVKYPYAPTTSNRRLGSL